MLHRVYAIVNVSSRIRRKNKHELCISSQLAQKVFIFYLKIWRNTFVELFSSLKGYEGELDEAVKK